MHLDKSLALVAQRPRPADLRVFRESIDPEWIEEALLATGTATIRRRRLPGGQVIWLVTGMALQRGRSITDVAASLDIALPGSGGPTAASSAITQARMRLGAEPMAWLFAVSAEHWADTSADRYRWRGLALYGVDGSTLRVADSDENREFFGAANGGHRGPSGYPLARVVALMVLRSHLLAAAAFGPYSTGEGTYARQLWQAVPDHSLSIVDRGFFAADVLIPLTRGGSNRHWLTRAKKNQRWRVLQRLGPNDFLVEMNVSPQARKNDPSLPATWTVRAILYQRKGFRPSWLLTSMLDSFAFPADEIVVLYHERWELELGYDEIKTEMLESEESLRSRNPALVQQELWGVLLAYNLIRLEMQRIADEARVPPTRISFVMALHLIWDEWAFSSATGSPGSIPRHLHDLRAKVLRFVLPARRPKRSYPRAVKIKMSNYPRKRRPSTEAR